MSDYRKYINALRKCAEEHEARDLAVIALKKVG